MKQTKRTHFFVEFDNLTSATVNSTPPTTLPTTSSSETGIKRDHLIICTSVCQSKKYIHFMAHM